MYWRVRPLGLFFHREIVLHRLHAGDLPSRPGRLGTRHEVQHLARERNDPRISLHINIGVLQMSVFREARLHACRNGLILLLHRVACRRGDHLQFVFHRLNAIKPCGDPLRRTLRLVGIDLPAEHYPALCRLNLDLSPFDPGIGREGDLGFRRVGNRLMLSERQSAIHDIEEGDLAESIRHDSRRALDSGTPKVTMYELSAGRAEVFIEVIQPPVPLVIFGAGHDAVPLVRFAKELGWHVTVVDPRPGYATRQKFPLADILVVCRPDEVHEHIEIHRGTVAVVMTHHYLYDADLLRTLLPLPLRYLGLLGSKRRTQRLLHEARKEGVLLSERNLDLVCGPIGLDIGADTPEEIALAIAAEIQAVLAGRSGGMLKIREGPLHEQSPAAIAITLSGTIHGVVSCGYAY